VHAYEAKFRRRVSAALLRLRSASPFFASLALFARIELDESAPTAQTNGRDIWFNPDFGRNLGANEFEAVLLHEVLHAALLHVPRRGTREPVLWNIAADIVVNGIIAGETKLKLPVGALRDRDWEKFHVEEVYDLLIRHPQRVPILQWNDLRLDARGGTGDGSDLETYWRHAREQAATLARAHGKVPAGMKREFGALGASKLDWRSYLWRFLVRTPVDFQGFDRRFIGRGLYLENLEGETLRVLACVDTSGSIDSALITQFLSEVAGILRAYPHLQCDLYFADAALDGPHPLSLYGDFPVPRGGGGTDFRPFFRVASEEESSVCVYLTDGFGSFPDAEPPNAVLWCVAPGGLEDEAFPFGEIVRLNG